MRACRLVSGPLELNLRSRLTPSRPETQPHPSLTPFAGPTLQGAQGHCFCACLSAVLCFFFFHNDLSPTTEQNALCDRQHLHASVQFLFESATDLGSE